MEMAAQVLTLRGHRVHMPEPLWSRWGSTSRCPYPLHGGKGTKQSFSLT